MSREQVRPKCDVCGLWKRRDHRCGGPVVTPKPRPKRRRLPRHPYYRKFGS